VALVAVMMAGYIEIPLFGTKSSDISISYNGSSGVLTVTNNSTDYSYYAFFNQIKNGA
jgi:hypothetical protein